MIEMEMREDHHIDRCMGESNSREFLQEHMLGFDDPEAIAEFGLEEESDSCLEQDVAMRFLNEQASTGEGDSVLLVRICPACPECFGGVAEHCPAVEPLTVSHQCGECSLHIVLITCLTKMRLKQESMKAGYHLLACSNLHTALSLALVLRSSLQRESTMSKA